MALHGLVPATSTEWMARLSGFGRRLAGWGWRGVSWLIATLASFAIVVSIATHVVPIALGMAASSVSLTGASGATAELLASVAVIEVVVVVGFACWAGVVVIRAIWRWRGRLLSALRAEKTNSDAETESSPALGTVSLKRRTSKTPSLTTRKAGGAEPKERAK